jgi:patatin-like phospholipase/acyl hydrolase
MVKKPRKNTLGKADRSNYFRILYIDRGGIRGIIPAAVLIQVETELCAHRKDNELKIGDCSDFIAGTSTGRIPTRHYLPLSGSNRY